MRIKDLACKVIWSVVFIGAVRIAHAQNHPEENENVLEEVIVTARKKAEPLQDVPIAVSAVKASAITRLRIRNIEDMSALVPSLTVTSNANPFTSSFKIRRIGNEGNIPDFEPDTGLFIDGAYRSRSGLGMGDLVDIEQLEVLRGPQSTLYGKNVNAGVISVSTAKPSAERIRAGEVAVGSNSLVEFRGYANDRLSDSLNGRIGLSCSSRDATDTNLTGADSNDRNQYALRGQLWIQPTNQLRARLIAAHANRDFAPQLAGMYYGPVVTNLTDSVVQNPETLRDTSQNWVDGVINENAYPILDNDPSNRVGQASDVLTFSQTTNDIIVNLEYLIETLTFTSITSYDTYDFVQNWNDAGQIGLDILEYRDRQRGDTFSQELRIEGDFSNTLNWQTGLYYYSNHFKRGDKAFPEFRLGQASDEVGAALGKMLLPMNAPAYGLPILGVPGDTGNYFENTKNTSHAVFAQATWDKTEELAFTLGLRYTNERKKVSLENSSHTRFTDPNAEDLPILVERLTSAARSFSARDSWSGISGTLTTAYHFNPDMMAYGSIATGFKGGGYNGGFGNTQPEKRPFDAERVVNYELGFKGDWRKHLRGNFAAFHTIYTDFQSASFIGLQWLVNNAESVKVNGIEADFWSKPSDSLSLNISATYALAEYDQYTQGSCYTGRSPTDAITGGCDLSGEQLPYAPKLTAKVGLQWEDSFGSGKLYSRLDTNWIGSQNVTSELNPSYGSQGSYALFNVVFGWKQGIHDLSIWTKNLTNKTFYIQKSQTNLFASLADGSYQSYLGQARVVGMTLRAYF